MIILSFVVYLLEIKFCEDSLGKLGTHPSNNWGGTLKRVVISLVNRVVL